MICVDASVAVKLVLTETPSDKAAALVFDAVRTGQTLIAPHLYLFETTNILRKRTWGNGMSLADAEESLATLHGFDITLLTMSALHREALALAHAYGFPAAYDAHYVVLARHFGCDFWTDDAKLWSALSSDMPFVRHIQDYPLATSSIPNGSAVDNN